MNMLTFAKMKHQDWVQNTSEDQCTLRSVFLPFVSDFRVSLNYRPERTRTRTWRNRGYSAAPGRRITRVKEVGLQEMTNRAPTCGGKLVEMTNMSAVPSAAKLQRRGLLPLYS